MEPRIQIWLFWILFLEIFWIWAIFSMEKTLYRWKLDFSHENLVCEEKKSLLQNRQVSLISCDSSHTTHPTPYSWASYSSFYCLVRGCSHSSFFFPLPEGGIWLAHHQYFWNMGQPPNIEAMLCHTSLWHPTYNWYRWKLTSN